ncbi:hypothetical protein TWF481_006060 [Arthrobotrys musiformis]|uniref:Uncharacterized protein n=1 Tax=Arthrobotrys musiformis TaxID=47236 RepID=A0AAV9WFK0_9PEZI
MLPKYLLLAALSLTATASPIASPAPLGLDILADILKDDTTLKDIKVANGGPLGPGLSGIVAVAEGILRQYGITKTFADIMDLDAGLLNIAAQILAVNGKEGIIAAPGKLLGSAPPKNVKLDAANQKILPTDIYKPTLPASEQDGVKFHNIDVVSFLPGVVDETWIVAFGGKKTHFGSKAACFSLTGPLQLSNDAIKVRCLSKDISGEDKGSPEEEKKPLKEEKCPTLAIAGIAGGKVITLGPALSARAEKVDRIIGCWGAIPEDALPKPAPNPPQSASDNDAALDRVVSPVVPKYAIFSFKGVLPQDE